jgi:hypothetical protein
MSCEVFATKLAPCSALWTRVLEMIFHQNTWYLCPTFVGAGNSIMFARVKMSLSKETHIFPKDMQAKSWGPSQVWDFPVIALG